MKIILCVFTMLFVNVGILLSYNNFEPQYDSIYSIQAMPSYDINQDGICDTVIGRYHSADILLPWLIKWGTDSTVTNGVPNLPKFTKLIYPDFRYTKVTMEYINCDADATKDLLFLFEGFATDTVSMDSSTSVVWSREAVDLFVIFGKPALRSYESLRLDTITSIKSYSNCIYKYDGISMQDTVNILYLPQNSVSLNKMSLQYDEQIPNELATNYDVLVYPNPFSNIIELEVKRMPVGDYTIFLYDNSGNVIFEESMYHRNSDDSYCKQILIGEEFASGNYYFVLNYNGQSVFNKHLILKK